MARILCAWEFGGDLGHIRRLLPIARELRRLGHEAAFVFLDLARLGPYAAEGFEWFQAPHMRLPPKQNPSPLSPSDVLLNLGYADAAGLAGALMGWRSLFGLWQPDLVVCDYAPGALLAARMRATPTVAVGNGFSLPPPAAPLEAYRPWNPVEANVLQRLDEKLLATVAKAFEMLRAGSPPRAAHELFAGDSHLLCNFAELDPFGPREGVEYSGPLADSVSGRDVAWKAEEHPRIFAYLKPRDPRFAAIVAALRKIAGEALVAAPGLTDAQAAELSSDRVRVLPDALKLDGILDSADLCISHAGPGFAARSLLAGVPLALVPMQLEQFRIARRLEAAGAAAMISPDDPPPDFATWLTDIAARSDLREGARALGHAHRGYDFDQAAARAAQRIAAALPG
jgi:UDP:flavonoid glycosyltransferase YjiC (YdhE family)